MIIRARNLSHSMGRFGLSVTFLGVFFFLFLPIVALTVTVGEENCMARKFFEFILAGVGLARKKSKFSSLGLVLSRQNGHIFAKMRQILATARKKS